MNVQRLLRLADLLDTVDPVVFDLNEWKCRTVACAVGHACLDPWFNEQGLRLVTEPYVGPCFDYRLGWFAVMRFFDINRGDAHRLFKDMYYDPNPLPTDVAKRIRNFANQNSV